MPIHPTKIDHKIDLFPCQKNRAKNDHLFGRSDSVDQAMVQMVRYMTSNPDCALPSWPFKCGIAHVRYRHGKIPANPTTEPQKLTTIQPHMSPSSSALDTKSPIAEGHQARQKCNMIKQVHVIIYIIMRCLLWLWYLQWCLQAMLVCFNGGTQSIKTFTALVPRFGVFVYKRCTSLTNTLFSKPLVPPPYLP